VESRSKNGIRAVFVAVLVAAVGWYLYALSTSGNRLDVTIVNQTGGPLTKLAVGDGITIERIDDQASATVSVPLVTEVTLRFVGQDGKSRISRYAYSNTSGIMHSLRIVLTKGAQSERNSHAKSTLLLGSEVSYDESLEYIDAVRESEGR
jgi:hypothetical protein